MAGGMAGRPRIVPVHLRSGAVGAARPEQSSGRYRTHAGQLESHARADHGRSAHYGSCSIPGTVGGLSRRPARERPRRADTHEPARGGSRRRTDWRCALAAGTGTGLRRLRLSGKHRHLHRSGAYGLPLAAAEGPEQRQGTAGHGAISVAQAAKSRFNCCKTSGRLIPYLSLTFVTSISRLSSTWRKSGSSNLGQISLSLGISTCHRSFRKSELGIFSTPSCWVEASLLPQGCDWVGYASGVRLSLPEARIVRNESRSVHLKIGDKPAPCALVPVGCGINATIKLLERLESETWEPQPGRPHRSLLSNGQIQPPDRQQVGRRAEVEVKVNAACHGGTLCSLSLQGEGIEVEPYRALTLSVPRPGAISPPIDAVLGHALIRKGCEHLKQAAALGQVEQVHPHLLVVA